MVFFLHLLLLVYLPIIIEPTIKKGGRHPNDNRRGNIRLPNNAPKRPNIIANDTAVVLKM